MPIHSIVNSFNAGELSPRLLARPDLDAYPRGCRTMENFLPTPYGSAERRPGTELFGYSIYGSSGRLVSFVFNDVNAYILVFRFDGGVSVRRFADTPEDRTYTYASVPGEYEPDPGAPVPEEGEEDTREMVPKRFFFPLAEDEWIDPWKFQFVQSADVVFIVHPDYPPHRLSRTGKDVFQMEEMPFRYPPSLDIDTSGTRLKCINKPGTGGGTRPPEPGETGTLYADKEIFKESDVGKRYLLTYRNSTKGTLTIAKTAAGDTGGFGKRLSWTRVKGAYTVTSHGTWTGTLSVQRKYSDTQPTSSEGAETIAVYSSENDFNVSLSGDEPEDDAWYSVYWSGSLAKTESTLNFMNPGFSMTGVVRATSFTDAKQMDCVCEKRLYSYGYASSWREGAFSPEKGYPQAVAIYQERLFLGGTSAHRNRIWGSRTNDWNNFEVAGQEDDSALDLTMCSPTVSRICWMQDKDALIVGTTEDEWAVSSSNGQNALSASNLRIRRNSAFGSCFPALSIMAQDILVFVQKDRKKVRSLFYSWEQDAFKSEEMTLLAEHVCRAGVREIHLQKSPETVLWAVLMDGSVASATIDTSQNVTAWARFSTSSRGKGVISMCILPGADGEDRVYMLVQRNKLVYKSDGLQEQPCYSLERMFPRKGWSALDTPMLDMAIRIEAHGDAEPYWGRTHGSSDCPISNIARINPTGNNALSVKFPSTIVPAPSLVLLTDDGECFPVSLDSIDAQRRTFTLPKEISGGWIGCLYTSELSPMPAEYGMQDGHSMLRKKTVHRVLVDVYDSMGGEVQVNGGPVSRICPRNSGDSWDAPVPQGSIEVSAPFSGHERRVETVVRQREPWPLNVSAIAQIME